MQLFEIFIPSASPDGIDITARIHAASWTEALKQGLARLGDSADVRHVMCDIHETGVSVTEPKSGRVFQIREGVDAAAGYAAVTPPVSARAVQPAPAPVPPPAPVVPAPAPVAAAPVAAPPPAPVAAKAAAPVAPPAPKKVAAAPVAAPAPVAAAPNAGFDDILDDVFVAAGRIYELKNLQSAADYLLELAMKAVAVESGRVFVSSINNTELTFAAARGPKSESLKDVHIPVGQGIVGFSVQEGVAIAVSDAQRDPRLYKGLSQKVGVPTRSVACSPAQREGRVYGAFELVNKKGGGTFTTADMNVLDYLANQFAEYVINTGQTDVA